MLKFKIKLIIKVWLKITGVFKIYELKQVVKC